MTLISGTHSRPYLGRGPAGSGSAIEVAVIAPIADLDLTVLGTVHMALAQLVLADGGNNPYARHYAAEARAGRTVMLDNGAFELELASGRGLDAETVLTAAELVGASEIVCTDVPYDGAATVESTRQFLEHALKYPAAGADRRYLGVPQGSTRDEWLDCYQAIAGMREVAVIGVSKLSVPMCWSTTGPGEVAEARLACVAELHAGDLPPKPLHLLGGDRSLAYELARHRALGHRQVRSSDSSAAAWYAAHDLRIDAATGRADAQLTGKPDLEHARLTGSQRQIACANISVLREHAGLPLASALHASLRGEGSN